MNKLILFIAVMLGPLGSFACEICKKQQPKVLSEITHGTGPQSDWDYMIVGVISIIVVVSLFYSIKWTIRPGERERKHIKHCILNMEQS